MATGVTITVTLDEISPVLARMARAAADLTPAMDRIGAEIEASIETRFKRGEGPGREAWRPSRRVLERGGQTLRDSGRLADSIVRRVGPRQVEVGTNVIYAAIHQFGGTIRPKRAARLAFTAPDGGAVFARQVTIPARPFMGIDADDVSVIAETLTAYFERVARSA